MNRPADVDFVEYLNLYYTCKAFSSLPRAGGVLDQPARIMVIFEMIQMAEFEKAERDNKSKAGKHAGNSP